MTKTFCDLCTDLADNTPTTMRHEVTQTDVDNTNVHLFVSIDIERRTGKPIDLCKSCTKKILMQTINIL